MGKVTQALKDKEEAKRLRSTANIIDVSDVPDPLLAEFMRYDARQLEASSEQSLNQHRSFLAGAGGELVPDGDQLKAGMNYIDTVSLSVTMDRYGHLFPSEDHKAAMDAIAGELLG